MAKLERKHAAMLRRRCLDPKLFEFVKETFTSVYFRNIITGIVKIIDKGARYN